MKKNKITCFVELTKSPLGMLKIEANSSHLIGLSFSGNSAAEYNGNQITKRTIEQLHEYFEGNRKTFQLPVRPPGTRFEQQVWSELQNIPYGSTTSYGRLARKLNDEKLVRAVGRANAANPIAIIIPCHRVVGSENSLTGYSGGLERKEWLLRHEGALLI